MTSLWAAAALLSGCSGHHAPEPPPNKLSVLQAGGVGSPVAQSLATGTPEALGTTRSRIIDEDPDADGIANYRTIITDTFDAGGNLVSTLQEEDFEADGVVDSRVMTSFVE